MKQVIILDNLPDENKDGHFRYRYALWLTVPATRQAFYANAQATSQYKSASGAEVAALQSGAVVEKIGVLDYDPSAKLATILTDLQGIYATAQAGFTNGNAWLHYGTSWDGATWNAVTVA